MNKKLITTITAITLIACSFFGILWYSMYATTVTQEKGISYYLRPGINKNQVVYDLAQMGIIRHPWIFLLYEHSFRDSHLKTGEYQFPKGASAATVWKQLMTGTGQIQHPLMIIPGWTFAQLRASLLAAPVLRHLMQNMDDKQVMTYFGHPELSPEGQFYPETYFYTRGASDLSVLKRAYNLMQQRLKTAWNKRAVALPYKNQYEALIAASLIEKEAYLQTERPMIAGVIINRLSKDMLLQIDATVIYGLGTSYDGKIHKADLLKDTIYNTYVHRGLPPTPIAMPSQASIDASVHPQMNDFFYYVGRGDGSHQFSKSLREHNEAVQTYTKLHTSFFNEEILRWQLLWLLEFNYRNSIVMANGD